MMRRLFNIYNEPLNHWKDVAERLLSIPMAHQLIGFYTVADDAESVQETENTEILVTKLKSGAVSDTLIVTSIQKMSRVEENGSFHAYDIGQIRKKRIVFIIDEAHRDVFGEMLRKIKETFPDAMFFGFTGTPIHDENQKKMNTTSDVFGNELHRYSIADGIRDGNVLGFDPCQVTTYKDRDLRKAVALEKAKAHTEAEALADPKKKKVYLHYMDHTRVPMAGVRGPDGNYRKGIEDYISNAQYERKEHKEAVVQDILDQWMTLSHGGQFHAIFAVSSIIEAIQYYKLFRAKGNALKITALFDPGILRKMNEIFDETARLFRSAGIENFEKLPDNYAERGVFAKLFKQFHKHLEAARIQGFTWRKLSYEFHGEQGESRIDLHLDETVYLILALRYKELFLFAGGSPAGDVPYEIDTYLTEINTGVIDADYMNSRFRKYLKTLQDHKETAAVLDELHKSFAVLTQEEQKYANIFLHDIQNGDVLVEDGKTLQDYITEYMVRAKNDQVHRFAEAVGVNEPELRRFMQLNAEEGNINEFGRFDRLKETVDKTTARIFLEKREGKPVKPFQVNMKIDQLLRRFVLEGGFDVDAE